MKVLLDIKDAKSAFIMELLNSFSFVKTKPLTPYKADVLEGLLEAVESMKLIKEGKLKPRPAKEVWDEL